MMLRQVGVGRYAELRVTTDVTEDQFMRKDARLGGSLDRLLRHLAAISMRLTLIALSLVPGGCALQGVVQKQGVEYNEAAAGMANQLALTNIIRAKEHLPIFYTSIARLSGSATVTAGGGFSAAIKTDSPVDTTGPTTSTATTTGNTTTTTSTLPPGTAPTTVAAAPVTSVVKTVTNAATQAITSGGNLYTPSVTGQIVSGPSFDINILDTQQFYQGVLQEVPLSTVETFVNQDFAKDLIMRLLIERIEYRFKETLDDDHPAGSLFQTVTNAPSDTPENGVASTLFLKAIACVDFRFDTHGKPPRLLVPASHVGSDKGGQLVSIRDLALLDGDKFDLAQKDPKHPKEYDITSGYLGSEDADDVFVVRVAKDSRVLVLSQPDTTCDSNEHLPPKIKPGPSLSDGIKPKPAVPPASGSPPTEPPRGSLQWEALGKLKYQIWKDTSSTTEPLKHRAGSAKCPFEDKLVECDVFVYFRSPEGVIRYLGKYLEAVENDGANTYSLDTKRPVFSVSKNNPRDAFVAVKFGKDTYSINQNLDMKPNLDMDTLALVEELIDLQKSGTDRPVTVPVHVLQ